MTSDHSVSFFQKLKLLFRFWTILPKLPAKFAIIKFINPIDSTRYVEFIYLLEFLKRNNIKKGKALDISSPFLMAYFLSDDFKVLKTDINDDEKKYIKESPHLKFEKADGTALTYPDNTFDISFSISVIEHIYQKYTDCINEMIRVTKPGGYIYVSFPISKVMSEEWIENDIYSDQHKSSEKTFFQYRFDEKNLNEIKNSIKNVEVVQEDLFWERKDGEYDRLIDKLRKKINNKYLSLVWFGIVNYYYGFTLISKASNSFKNSSSFGNYQGIFRKI